MNLIYGGFEILFQKGLWKLVIVKPVGRECRASRTREQNFCLTPAQVLSRRDRAHDNGGGVFSACVRAVSAGAHRVHTRMQE